VPLAKAHKALAQAESDMGNRGVELVIHIDPVAVQNEWNHHRYHDAERYYTAGFAGQRTMER